MGERQIDDGAVGVFSGQVRVYGWLPIFPYERPRLDEGFGGDSGTPSVQVYREYLASCERIATAVGSERVGRLAIGARDDGVVRDVVSTGDANGRSNVAVGFGTHDSGFGGSVGVGHAVGAQDVTDRNIQDGQESVVRCSSCAGKVAEPPVVSESVDGSKVACGSRLRGLPRGPNYERNQANRLRKKAARAAERAGLVLAGGATLGAAGVPSQEVEDRRVGVFSELDEGVQRELVETRAERLILENKARIEELKERNSKRRHGLHHAIEATKTMKMADDWRKAANVKGPGAKVYGWAETIATESSESIARASPVRSLATVDSKVSSKSSVSVADHSLTLGNLDMNGFEEFLSRFASWKASKLVTTRKKLGRAIQVDDCVGPKSTVEVGRRTIETYLDELIRADPICY